VRRPSKWVIIVTFVDGESRYYSGPLSEHEWVRTRGSAARYESEMDALYHRLRAEGALPPAQQPHRRGSGRGDREPSKSNFNERSKWMIQSRAGCA